MSLLLKSNCITTDLDDIAITVFLAGLASELKDNYLKKAVIELKISATDTRLYCTSIKMLLVFINILAFFKKVLKSITDIEWRSVRRAKFEGAWKSVPIGDNVDQIFLFFDSSGNMIYDKCFIQKNERILQKYSISKNRIYLQKESSERKEEMAFRFENKNKLKLIVDSKEITFYRVLIQNL